jgi:epoxyqueuosine reductase
MDSPGKGVHGMPGGDYNRFMEMTPHAQAARVKDLAREMGFDLVGVARAEPSAHGEALRAWLAAGMQGAMAFLERGVEERVDLRKKFPWARSVVCVAVSYFARDEATERQGDAGMGKIARYAWGRDYHKVLEGKLKKLERRVRETLGGGGGAMEIRSYVDTGPLLEREWAARAGLGWVGKNTLLIHPRQGSWFVLGEMVMSAELEPDSPMSDHCGTCRRCIEACPTGAITPHCVDARKCISYQTLENRGQVPEEMNGAMVEAGYLIGCDICQEVCPFNGEGRVLETREADFAARAPAPAVPLAEVLAWQEQEWDILTRGRAGRRAKFEMWKRNARIVQRRL